MAGVIIPIIVVVIPIIPIIVVIYGYMMGLKHIIYIYIYLYLVGGMPTPLKNDGVRQREG